MNAWHLVVFEGLIVAYLIDQNSCCRPHRFQIFGFLLILINATREITPYFIVTFSCPKWPIVTFSCPKWPIVTFSSPKGPILWIFSYQNYL
jgi:hypothetical protein